MSCLVDKKNLGFSKCNELPANPKAFLTTPASFSLTAEEAADIENWQDLLIAVKASRGYLWPDIFTFEDKSEEAVYARTPNAVKAVRDGRYEWLFGISENLCIHKAMYSHRGSGDRVFVLDANNKIIGTELSDGNFAGLTIGLLNTEKMKWNNGTDPSVSPVLLSLKDNREFDQNGVMFDFDFVNELNKLTDVSVKTVGVIADDAITVSVLTTCDGTPVLGLLATDFVLTETDGTPQVIAARVDNGDGTYLLSGADWVDGFVNIKPANTLSITAYESTGKVVVNVP